MADQDPKSHPWRDELPALDTLLSTAELDAPPPGLEARLLRCLREVEPLQAAPVPSELSEAAPDSAVVAAEPARIPSLKPSGLRSQRLWVCVVAAAIAVLLLRHARDAGDGSGQANDRRTLALPVYGMASRDEPTACTGTYLIRASDGSSSFWTFHPDGTLLSTSANRGNGSLGTQHGSWKAEGPLSARALRIGLHVSARGTLTGVERVDLTLRGENAGCNTVAGELSARSFKPGEDFLHPKEHSSNTTSFTGFRVKVTP